MTPAITKVTRELSIGSNIDGITLYGQAGSVLVLSGGVVKAVPYFNAVDGLAQTFSWSSTPSFLPPAWPGGI